jgi:hypothetical protein
MFYSDIHRRFSKGLRAVVCEQMPEGPDGKRLPGPPSYPFIGNTIAAYQVP